MESIIWPTTHVRYHPLFSIYKEIFYPVGHTGVIYDYGNNTQRLLQGHCNSITCTAYNQREDIIVTADVYSSYILNIPVDPIPCSLFGTQKPEFQEKQFSTPTNREPRHLIYLPTGNILWLWVKIRIWILEIKWLPFGSGKAKFRRRFLRIWIRDFLKLSTGFFLH